MCVRANGVPIRPVATVGEELKGHLPAESHGPTAASSLGDSWPETHLQMRVEPVRIPIMTRVHILLGICVFDTTVVAVGVIGHEELHVGLLGL